MKILLNTINSVYNFANSCGRYFDGEITVKQGKHCVDGKSIIGLFSLNLLEPLEVEIETDNLDIKNNFYNYIKIWKVES